MMSLLRSTTHTMHVSGTLIFTSNLNQVFFISSATYKTKRRTKKRPHTITPPPLRERILTKDL